MTNPFHASISFQLEKLLLERRVVVFYDPREEFGPFIDEFEIIGAGLGNLFKICVNNTETYLANYEGSFFALKSAVEPVVDADFPQPLLVYVAAKARNHETSVLMELEKAGACYEPQLRRLARNELRRRYTDGVIDEMLAPESLTYRDVVQLLRQDDDGPASMIRLVLGEGASETLLAQWLTSDSHDSAIEEKLAIVELYGLIQSRLGLCLSPDTPLGKARHQTLRYLLINEFRNDLLCAPPQSLAIVPPSSKQEENQRIHILAKLLRREHGDWYIEVSEAIEAELELTKLNIDPSALGSIDTFSFEEHMLLDLAAQLVIKGHYDKALEIVSARNRSFWVERDIGHRLAQWEACRRMAELGREVRRVGSLLKMTESSSTKWVEAYAAKNGWFEVDRAQRALEAFVGEMRYEPEQQLERALGLVRRSHEALLEEMAQGFSKALSSSGWSVPGVLHQTNIYSEAVEPAGGRVALFAIDAMRYEMGANLVDLLENAKDLRLVPAIAALPSITPVGMAALLPGASASFTVIEHNGKLAPRIGDKVLPELKERKKYLEAIRPDSQEIDLGELLQSSIRAIEKKLGDARMILVRSQSIDGVGEMDSGHLARKIMDTIIANVARAVHRLARIGVEFFIITSDHGHQFSLRKGEDMTMDKPGGATVDQHRRCWVGRGGQAPAACVRVTSAELGYDSDLDFIFPKGIAVFKTGGDLAYHHGGISLQEMIVPVVSLRIPGVSKKPSTGLKVIIEGYPKVLTNRTFGMRLFIQPDLLTEGKISVRLVLLAQGQEVGRAGMALDAEMDRSTSTVKVTPGKAVSIGMMLTRDDIEKVRIIAQEPSTDTILAQSEEIDVKLGI